MMNYLPFVIKAQCTGLDEWDDSAQQCTPFWIVTRLYLMLFQLG